MPKKRITLLNIGILPEMQNYYRKKLPCFSTLTPEMQRLRPVDQFRFPGARQQPEDCAIIHNNKPIQRPGFVEERILA